MRVSLITAMARGLLPLAFNCLVISKVKSCKMLCRNVACLSRAHLSTSGATNTSMVRNRASMASTAVATSR